MADTGYNWGAWAYADYSSGTDWNDLSITDTNGQTSDAIDLDNKAACEIGIKITGTGTVTGNVTVLILGNTGDDGATADEFEDENYGSPFGVTLIPVTGQSVRKRIFVDPAMYSKFKVHVQNESGITLTTTVEVKTAAVPAAS